MANKILEATISMIGYSATLATITNLTIFPGRAEITENPPIKDGRPCIEEICINDEVKNLPRLNWKKVPVDKGNYSPALKAVGEPSAVETFLRYRNIGWIDSIGLQALSRIKGFCQMPIENSFGLQGEYTNKKGQLITVSFAIVPSEDSKSQKFIVTNIFKRIQKEEVTGIQYKDLAIQAKARYQSYYYGDSAKSPQYPNVSLINNSMRGVTLHITSQFGKIPDGIVIDPSKFQYFPGCGGDKKITL
jgi:hypothetical protein